ncbi:protein of unknown function [Pedobacter westerhofensis]|uniref:DUF4293 domain-containing protein n=1 Tax=Pedobacter westerhofensis TaxID=425512 RepID=A0A521DCA1_9SPHI|nr:DUF4293 domain-containing protein [Pedobacter westerhofensis]SMO69212.1 protein of unknown function [Pedobacter westerhofensis]
MIQRVQSVWLFLAALTLFLLLILPVVTVPTSTGLNWLQVGGIYSTANNITQKTVSYSALFGGTILAGMICLAAIFLFNNRALQKRIVLLAIFVIILVIAAIVYYALNIPGGIVGAVFNLGAYLPFLSVIFCALAFRGIRKDEQLIRSADRLR